MREDWDFGDLLIANNGSDKSESLQTFYPGNPPAVSISVGD